jgi:flagellar hook-associated protein FlgK
MATTTKTQTTVQQLKAERARILALVTATDDEYRAKWTRVNELTSAIATANGGITKKMERY